MDYELANRRILARYIKSKRRAMKITMIEWAAKVGRSTRTMQGVERGDAQGSETYVLTAEALGVDPEVVFAILDSGTLPTNPVAAPTPPEQIVAELVARIERLERDSKRPASSRTRRTDQATPSSQS